MLIVILDRSMVNNTNSSLTTQFPLRVWELVWYSIICLVGLVGNFLVCFVIVRSGPAVRNAPFNLLLMSLAVADLLTAGVVVPVYVLSTSFYDHPSGKSGERLCKTITGYGIPFYLALVSVYCLVAISFERLRAVARPLAAYTDNSTRRTWISIILIWAGAGLVELPTVFGIFYSRKKAQVGNFCYYTWKYSWIPAVTYGSVFTIQFIIPFLIFCYTFYKIKLCFKSMDAAVEGLNVAQAIEQQKLRIKKRKRTVYIVFLVVLTFFVCWTPNNLMYFMFQYLGFGNMDWNSVIYQIGVLMAFSSSFINPFLYSFQSAEFRRHCREVFGQCHIRKCKSARGYKLSKSDENSENDCDSLLQSTSERVRASSYPL